MSEPEETGSSEQEARFLAWIQSESRARDLQRLRYRLAQLERLQLAGYGFIFFWVAAMFFGYRLWPRLVPAEVAGLVTLWVFLAGGLVVWQIIRAKRKVQQQLQAASVEEQPATDEPGE